MKVMNCNFCGIQFVYRRRNIKRNKNFYCSKDCGYKAKIRRMRVSCDWCGTHFDKKISDINRSKHNFCKHKCSVDFTRWTGKRNVNPKLNGVHIHRKIMEEYLGRKLHIDEEVHHIDGNHLNNRIENMVVISKSEHSRIHASMKKRGTNGRFTK